MYWVSRFIKHSLAGALTLKRYCRLQLAGQNQYLHVPSSLDIKLDIDRIFIPLTLEHYGGEKGSYNHTDLLTVGNRIRVIGDPGSGKSSLIKRLFRDACVEAIKNPSKSRLPVMLELKNLEVQDNINSQDLSKWLYDKLRSDVEKCAVYQMADCFDNYAKSTGLLVLLDGLDEVSTIHYLKVQEAIKGLSEKLYHLSDKTIIVLTMRTQFHQQIKVAYRDSFGPALFLKPFSPSDLYDFLTRWPFKDNLMQNISRIYKELTDRPTLREMCSNPLVLSMYVAEDQAAGHVMVPESRTEFYSKVTEELIIRRRLRQTGPTPVPTKLREQRERILGKLAYEHLLDVNQSINSLQWVDALRITREVLDCKETEAESIFQELAKETGLITEERIRQSFRFIHLTFCEFLAAYEAVQGQVDGWSKLIEAHAQFQDHAEPQLHSRLLEVIPFACALLPRVARYDALTDLAKLGDKRLLARSFLETKLYDHVAWKDFVETESQSLLNTPEKNWDDQWLRDLYLFNVVVRDANQCATHIPMMSSAVNLEEFFQSLVDRQQESLSTLLTAYASQDAAAAFRLAEVCNLDLAEEFPEIIISNCAQSPFFALVQEQALHELDRIGLWASLLTEAALRSRIVANVMSNTKPLASLSKFIDELPRKKRWFLPGTISQSLYTQCLSIAVGRSKSIISLVMLNIIRTVPPPGLFFWRIIFSRILAIIIGISTIFLITYDIITRLKASSFIGRITFILLLISSATCMYYIFFRIIALKNAYAEILQIERDSSSNIMFKNRLIIGLYKITDSLSAHFLGRKFGNLVKKITQQRETSFSEG